MTALARQVGGTHYINRAVQPFEFTLRNGWDGAAHSIVKYLTRFRDKGGALDLQKALHIAEIRLTLWGPWLLPMQQPLEKMLMCHYVAANGITGSAARALAYLELWVEDHERKDCYDAMVIEMTHLIENFTTQTG